MVRAGRAAARDPNAPQAAEQAIQGLGDPPQLLEHMGSVVASAASVVGSLAYGLREAFRSRVHELPIRIDRFPWLDLDEPATLQLPRGIRTTGHLKRTSKRPAHRRLRQDALYHLF
ncbi:MAG: hypothetical protein M1840_004289 [Geoglossum simile]|nr:MAG: hypothetical protein M1840_004289 [Geoglossum simile]